MTLHGLDDLLAAQQDGDSPYIEFLRSPALSAGLFVLAAGAIDTQQPHSEDEIYVVLRGRGRFTIANETRDVRGGDTIFVGAGIEHRFHDISEQLVLIVVFAPPEGSSTAP